MKIHSSLKGGNEADEVGGQGTAITVLSLPRMKATPGEIRVGHGVYNLVVSNTKMGFLSIV